MTHAATEAIYVGLVVDALVVGTIDKESGLSADVIESIVDLIVPFY
jgi:hypothetical protein